MYLVQTENIYNKSVLHVLTRRN